MMRWFPKWADVDPARHAFDADRCLEIVRRVATPHLKGSGNDRALAPRDDLVVSRNLDIAFVAAFGAWANEWSWTATEQGGGGPVKDWCCVEHSLKGDDAEERLAGLLVQYRAWLAELSALFEALHREIGQLEPGESAALAALRLIPFVVRTTDATDAWYRTLMVVVTWYLEADFGADVAWRLVQEALHGRFQSWVQPKPPEVEQAAAKLRGVVTREATEPPPQADATAAWLANRGNGPVIPFYMEGRRVSEGDGHKSYIENREWARDAERALRMSEALDLARAAAARGEALDFAKMATWQRIVLARPEVDFRRGEAYAKGGRERYPLEADTRATFLRCLAEANDESEGPARRAARAFLDVCFFHPFDDGNARAARLAMDYVLTRSGLVLDAPEILFVVPYSAFEPNLMYGLTSTLEAGCSRLPSAAAR